MEPNENNIDELFDLLIQRYKEIPFDNSGFQNIFIVARGEITPERAYRHIGLRLFNRIRALKNAKYSMQKEDIDIEELEHKILAEGNEFDKRRWKIEIEEKLDNRKYTKKLIHDALEEVRCLFTMHQALPQYTRKEFEAGEKKHFEEKYKRNAILNPSLQGLLNIGYSMTDTLNIFNNKKLNLCEYEELIELEKLVYNAPD